MTDFIAISNRKGGVGKTTLTMMTAYGFALYGQKRVLVIDLDAQASSSLSFLGADRWIEAKDSGRHAGDMLINAFGDGKNIDISQFIVQGGGDVISPPRDPVIDVIPSSSALDDSERTLLYMMAQSEPTLEEVFYDIERKVANIIRSADGLYDVVILDCPPGLSCAAWGGLRAADYALIPYTADPTAEDNIRALMKNVLLRDIETRFIPIANRVGNAGGSAMVIDAIEHEYGKFGLQIPSRQALVNALSYNEEPVSPSIKFGSARNLVENLHEAILTWKHHAPQTVPIENEYASA
ncbi:MAG: hypothetical protein DHS20C08_14930 [Rhodomicrobium sp.]|nr:MAG: hypothetical protein DHS20C08_14930 [Rhodomicrobium sp.]